MKSSPVSTRAYTPAGVAAAAAGTFTWGIGVVLVKLTVSPFLVVAFYKHIFSLPILIAIWLLGSDRKLPWRAATVGGLLFAAHQLANFSALRYSTAAVVTILFSLQPILVGAAGRRVTGERTSPRFYAWALVAVAGCAVLIITSAGQPSATPLGTLLAVVNLLAWSAYYLATKRARVEFGTISWLVVMTIVSTICISVITLAARQPLGSPDVREFTYLALIAIVPGTIGHVLVTWAQPRIHAAASSSIILGVPIVAAIGAAIFAGEPFGRWHLLGVLIAIGGSAAAISQLPPTVVGEAAETFGEVAT
jgi:drug/metabolite transporter (DMT)-like permease